MVPGRIGTQSDPEEERIGVPKVHPDIEAFSILGQFLGQFPAGKRKNGSSIDRINDSHYHSFSKILENEPLQNPWFTSEFLLRALEGISSMLKKEVLQKWCASYPGLPVEEDRVKTVGLVLAGNIPLVGFHDVLSVLISGHRTLVRPSSKDDRLIAVIAEILTDLSPRLGERFKLTEDKLKGIDAVIATGSDHSARHFEYYFRDMDYIIRKNRNGVAILTGSESEEELHSLGKDIFTYFGLGCRNITKIYVPEDYDLTLFMGAMDLFAELGKHHKYANNVDYYRSIYLINLVEFLDNGFLLLKEDPAIASPVGVVFYERYSEIEQVLDELDARKNEIQCKVCIDEGIPGTLAPGKTQDPMPWDYADGVDTLKFLSEL